MIHQFGLREGSGGIGKWHGGEGVVRDFEFLEPMQVSIMSEVRTRRRPSFQRNLTPVSFFTFQRRTRQPYGMEGGAPGAMGHNTWLKQCREGDGDFDGENGVRTRSINIGGKATVWMGKGDHLLVETPGGGAWGPPEGSKKGQPIHVHAWEPRGSIADRAAAQAAF